MLSTNKKSKSIPKTPTRQRSQLRSSIVRLKPQSKSIHTSRHISKKRINQSNTFISTTTPNNHLNQNNTQHISKRFYDIPHYSGFRDAFSQQLHAYAQKAKTPVSLHHFLHWPINHYQSNVTKNDSQTKNPTRPSLDVQNLNDQVYSPEYQKKLIENAQFLWHELPIRLAQRVVELENLPYGLSSTPQFLLVKHWYECSFRDIITSLPPVDAAQDRNFTRVLNVVLNRHRSVIPTLAQGILLQKPIIFATTQNQPCPYIKQFLDSFYSSRIAIRMLIAQHIALHKPVAGFCGTIHLELDPITTIRAASQEAMDLCERTYSYAPDINIFASDHSSHRLQDRTFPDMNSFNPDYRLKTETIEKQRIINKMNTCTYYSDYIPEPGHLSYVSSHLFHGLFELFKNSSRAHAEYYSKTTSAKNMPNINVFVSNGQNGDITIKISDYGGGISNKNQHQLFSYLYTTADSKVQETLKRFDITNTIKQSGLAFSHDDHITMLSPSPNQLTSQPLSIKSKIGLMSISNSSIMAPNSLGTMGSIGGNSSSGSLHQHDSNATTTTTSTTTTTMTTTTISSPHPQDQQVQLTQQQQQTTSTTTQPTGGGGDDLMNDGGVFIMANEQQGFGSGMQVTPISGFGYGLALSKLFAKFGNGDLKLHTIEGLGTDAMLTLHQVSSTEAKSYQF